MNIKKILCIGRPFEAKKAKTINFPDSIHPSIKEALQKRGIHDLYTHQREAYESVMKRKNIVAVTPTASGKTLCYNLPVLETIIENLNARALYIFPTKALAQDQKSEINELIQEAGLNINSYTYDGDTPANIRQKVRKAGHIVITNPDMLHLAILPHHTKWVSLFENLQYIIIDELQQYVRMKYITKKKKKNHCCCCSWVGGGVRVGWAGVWWLCLGAAGCWFSLALLWACGWGWLGTGLRWAGERVSGLAGLG